MGILFGGFRALTLSSRVYLNPPKPTFVGSYMGFIGDPKKSRFWWVKVGHTYMYYHCKTVQSRLFAKSLEA